MERQPSIERDTLALETKHEIKKESRVKDITQLTVEDKESLNQRLQETRGLARIFVHPYYREPHPTEHFDPIYQKRHPKIELIQTFIQKTLEGKLKNVPPLIIFEEQWRMTATEALLSEFAKNSEVPVYLVPTQPDSSEPKFTPLAKELPHAVRDEEWMREKNWGKLIEILRDVGVQRVLVGGMNLDFEQRDIPLLLRTQDHKDFTAYKQQRQRKGAKNVKYNIHACVGWAVKKLSKQFDVEISSLTLPFSRIDIARAEDMGTEGIAPVTEASPVSTLAQEEPIL